MSTSDNQKEMKDTDLIGYATKFLQTFATAAKNSNTSATQLQKGHPYALGPAGIVELTDDIIDAKSDFVHRAAKLLKSKAAHEKAISDIATNYAHEFAAGNKKIETAVTDMIKSVFEQGNASFSYLAPNYLVRIDGTVKEVKVGRVRALRTEDFSSEWKSLDSTHPVTLVPGTGFSLQLAPKIIIEMLPICWIVDVDAVAENVEEEGKWLIDVAVSFLRLSHQKWSGHFPAVGSVEPHPLRATLPHNEGVKLQGSKILVGGSSVPAWYEIDAAVVATTQEAKFTSQAEIIFDPPKRSLAERVSQGLGWLTRGGTSRRPRGEAPIFLYSH